MIIYHKHHEIDRDRWDECIRKSFNGIIYAYSWYLDIVSPQWEALIEGGRNGGFSGLSRLSGSFHSTKQTRRTK